MALLRLERHEAEGGYLPPVCMRCGAEATCQRRKNFKKNAHSGMVVQTWLVAPLCDGHRGHWVWRRIFVPVLFFVVIIAYCSGMILMLQAKAVAQSIEGFLCPGGLLGILAWGVVAFIVHRTSIHVSEVDVDSVLVKGVSDEFIAGLQKHRESAQRGLPLALPGVEQTHRQVRVFRDEVAVLPAVCICCGEAGIHRVSRKYKTRIRKQATAGDIIGGLSFAIVGIGYFSTGESIGTPWQVPFPICARHRNYWRNRLWLILGGFVPPVVGLGLAYGQFLPPSATLTVGLWSILGLAFWAIVSIFIHEMSNKVADTTESSLVLRNVSHRFVDAVEEQRRREGLSPIALAKLGGDVHSTDIQPGPSQPPGDAYGPASP